MLNQLQFTSSGEIKDKVEIAIKRLKTFEPPEGYYVAFSGGKDSQCVYHLCKMAGVKFDAHYSVTSVDPPELVQFIKRNYPDVKFDRQHDKDGMPITMWSLIPEKRMPPTRIVRYCCEKLKESNGKDRFTVTGVRWAESVNRKQNQGVIVFPDAGQRIKRQMENEKIDYRQTKRGGVILNFDDAPDRRMVEFCMRTGKRMMNPIIDWEEDDVWQFLNGNGINYCSLYDEGFTRLGCIGCPMANSKNRERDFARWPKYRTLYNKAFERMIARRKADGLPCEWETADDVMRWWINPNQGDKA